MRNVTIKTGRGRRLRGFTLIELLVVITIIILVSAVALAVVPGLAGNYQLTEGARIVQAAFVGARDAAIRASAPRGFRMLPDPSLSDPIGTPGGRLVINRLLPIEPAPDLSEGFATFPRTTVGGTPAWVWNNMGNSPGLPPTYPIAGPTIPYQDPNKTFTLQQVYPYYDPFTINANNALPLPNPFLNNRVLMVMESKFQKNDTSNVAIPNPPTNWFWNVRIGDKFRFNDSGQYYTVVGPLTVPPSQNPELFVNIGRPGATLASTEALQVTYPDPTNKPNGTITVYPEFLFLVNSNDDNANGFVDEGFNNVDENLDGVADDIGEWFGSAKVGSNFIIGYSATAPNPESEQWKGAQNSPSFAFNTKPPETTYTIVRRPVPSPGAREVLLPSSVVIDLTTYDTTRERSRLPAPQNGVIDILLNPSGQLIPTTVYSTPAATRFDASFYHFWISDRSDVYSPNNPPGGPVYPALPLPESTPGYLGTLFLKKDRQLVTFFTRSGQVLTNSINNFDLVTPDANRPYYDAQQGIREAK